MLTQPQTPVSATTSAVTHINPDSISLDGSSTSGGDRSHTSYLSTKHFGSLDGLRALSILAVIWHHTAGATASGSVLPHFGAHGVTLFFAISGFLITTLLVREFARKGHIDLKAFYIRRSLRIFPAYYAVLCLYAIAVYLFESNSPDGLEFIRNLKYFATYTSNIFVELDERVIFYFAWSLATEEQFYLVWPPLLILLASWSRAVAVLAFCLTALIATQLWGINYLSLIPVAIVGGSLIALLLHQRQTYQALARVFAHTWSAPLALLTVVLSLVIDGIPTFVAHAACIALVTACIITEKHGLAAPLRLRALSFIGSISYGMYLLHMLCANSVEKLLQSVMTADPATVIFPLTVASSVAAATVSYYGFERRFLQLKAKYSS